jgi:hypothetical protein
MRDMLGEPGAAGRAASMMVEDLEALGADQTSSG